MGGLCYLVHSGNDPYNVEMSLCILDLKRLNFTNEKWKTLHAIVFADGLTDCEDPECCENPVCSKSQLCHTVRPPIDILLRKQVGHNHHTKYLFCTIPEKVGK